jgi:hypothetical protein
LPGGLPADGLRRGRGGAWEPSEKTSPTDIAAYLWSTLAAENLHIIEPSEASRRLDQTLAALARLERVHGFFLDRFDPSTAATLKRRQAPRKADRPLVSAVDNGWLAAALIMVSNTKPVQRQRADELLRPMDFGFLYDA